LLREIDIEAIFSVPSAGEFDIGKTRKPRSCARIIYSSNKSGNWQLYLGQSDSLTFSLNHEKQISLGEDDVKTRRSITYGRFSLDASSLLFGSDYDGDEKYDIYLLQGLSTDDSDDNALSRPQNITPNTDYSILPNFSFSPDGNEVVFVSNSSSKFAVYTLDISDFTTQRVSNHDYSDTFAVFSPSGKSIAFSSSTEGQDQWLFIAFLDEERRSERSGRVAKEIIVLKDEDGKNPLDASDPAWSPDGRSIAFVSSSKGYYDIGIWEVSQLEQRKLEQSGALTWLTNSDFEYYEPSFSHDGSKMVYTANMLGDIRLIIHELDKGKERKIVDFRHGVVSSPKFSPDDKAIFFLFSSPRSPQDLWAYRLSDSRFFNLTKNLRNNIPVNGFVDGKYVEYRCVKDEMTIPALLFLPKGRKPEKLPTVIDIHGGPTSQALNSWNPFVQVLVSNGIAVLQPNYRGSTGYGRKFREANRFVMGNLDLADCVSGKDFLVKEGISDPERVAVRGGSFGGYLTMCALTKYPDEWVCGSALFPFLNWFTEMENEREDLRYWDYQNMGDPNVDKERLREASPIFFLDRVKCPVQIIGGANDPRCPLEEAEQAKKILESLRKDVDFIVYEDEGHGFRSLKNRIDAYKRSIAFLERHLLS
jgi:dipeptidyl aminopeptidase/acylaminoacyl peptidase